MRRPRYQRETEDLADVVVYAHDCGQVCDNASEFEVKIGEIGMFDRIMINSITDEWAEGWTGAYGCCR